MSLLPLEPERARQLHIGALGAAVVLALVALFALGGAGNAGARLLVILVLLALVGLEGWMWWSARKAEEHGASLEQQLWNTPEATPAERITIRCKQCGEVFPVEDTGARPLVAACPHCGKSGTIKVRTDAR